MIQLYKTARAETAANILLQHFRAVRIDCAYMNVTRGLDKRVRFRADDVKTAKVYFAKVPSQIKRWQERGGALICWTWRGDIECDAMLFAEAPKRMEQLRPATRAVRSVGVIYEPPSWVPYVEVIAQRHKDHPGKLRRLQRSLTIMQDYVADLPVLTHRAMRSLLARQAASRSSPSPESPAAVAHSRCMSG